MHPENRSSTSSGSLVNARSLSLATAQVFGVLLPAVMAMAQSPIYSNYSSDRTRPALAPTATTLSGVAAPLGGFWSELASNATSANAVAGLSSLSGSSLVIPHRTASRMVISAGGWRVQGLRLYAYQSGGSLTPPFASVNLRIWNGKPDVLGSVVVFGDTSTNRLVSQTATNIYRVFSTAAIAGSAPASLPDFSRPIWQIDVSIPTLALTPGTYWLDWQITSTNPSGDAMIPAVTTTPGPQARALVTTPGSQYRTNALGAGAWVDMVDPGRPSSSADVPIDVPYVVLGVSKCGIADISGGPGGLGDFDGVVSVQDIFDFLTLWFANNPLADVNGSGAVSTQDIFDFLGAWFAGC